MFDHQMAGAPVRGDRNARKRGLPVAASRVCLPWFLRWAIACLVWAGPGLGVAACQRGQEKRITFYVIPAVMPDSAGVFITGNHPKLGNWRPDAFALAPQPDGSWTRRLRLPLGTEIEFKVTRGDWTKEAVSAEGLVPENTKVAVTGDDTIRIEVAGWKDLAHRVRGQITGQVAYHRNLAAEGLRPRDVLVWLPPSYRVAPKKRYPVLYMHDGQNIVDPKTAFIQVDWQVDEAADSLIQIGKLEEIIIVGVYNTPDRSEEYAYTEKGRAYMRFLTTRLKPFIDERYRTLPDRAHTAVMGSSMGGLISFLLVWYHADVFAMAACLSPAFVPPYDRHSVGAVRDGPAPAWPTKIYIDNGGVGREARLQPGCEAMLAALQARGLELGRNLYWFRDPGAEHSERAWARRVWRPLLFLFGRDRTQPQ